MKYKVGILGGLGPLATCKLYEMIINNTLASCDQEHIEMVILNNCTTPDRTDAIINNGPDPVAKLNEGIKTLEELGCLFFAMPCNTAHYFKNRLVYHNIQMIDMIDETLKVLIENYKGAKVCVLCTNGTRLTKVYEKNNNVYIRYPNEDTQNQVMEVIYQTKAGFDKLDLLKEIINKEKDNFDVFLLACTELSIYYDKLKSQSNIIDAMDILSKAIILNCDKKLKCIN